jgi:hypothetical protein
VIYHIRSRWPAAEADTAGVRWVSSSEAVEPATKMKKIPNSSRRLREHILRALNKIRKPSTAGEITELLNRDLDLEDRPFQEKDVEEWLRNTEDTALTLYWSRARPRK